MPLLNLDNEVDLNVRLVPVPELGNGTTVCIGEMTADEQDDRLWKPWNDFKESTKQENNRRFRSFVVAACMCDENRNFTYEPEKLPAIAGKLAGKSAKAIQRMYLASSQLNGIGDVEVEKIEKNS